MHFRWTGPRKTLYELAAGWEEEEQESAGRVWPYRAIVTELMFHADLRYHHYIQFQSEGDYPARLKKWLENLDDESHQKILLRLARHVFFVDSRQLAALYRHAFRGCIVPIAERGMGIEELLSPDYNSRLLSRLNRFRIYSVTESLSIPEFLHENSLNGLRRPEQLGTEPDRALQHLPRSWETFDGVVVMEDFVSTGKQTKATLLAVRNYIPREKAVVFIPLIASDLAGSAFAELRANGVEVIPVLQLRSDDRLAPNPQADENEEFSAFRPLVRILRDRVIETSGPSDDPPSSEFGYKESGGLLVTAHNAPNNTLPLIHHKAPTWAPLFRRLQHARGT